MSPAAERPSYSAAGHRLRVAVKHNQSARPQDMSAVFADTERRTCTVPGGLGLRSLIRVWTIQQNFRPDVSIGLLSDRVGRQPWPLAS